MRSSLSLLRSSLFGFFKNPESGLCLAQLVGEGIRGGGVRRAARLVGHGRHLRADFRAREQLADREEVLVILLAVYRKRRYVTVLAAVSRCVDFHSLAVFEMYPGFLEERRTEGVFSGAGGHWVESERREDVPG